MSKHWGETTDSERKNFSKYALVFLSLFLVLLLLLYRSIFLIGLCIFFIVANIVQLWLVKDAPNIPVVSYEGEESEEREENEEDEEIARKELG